MRLLFILLCVLLASCCPTIVGSPGDIAAASWRGKPIEGDGQVIDCKGGNVGRLSIKSSHVTLRNCTIEGGVRIWGPARNANNPELRERSRKGDYVSWLRSQAPTGVLIEDCHLIADEGVPLYVGPGVTFTMIRRVKITGHSVSTMVYLGAESHGTIIEDTEIDALGAHREAIAVDASDHNVVRRSWIRHRSGEKNGGIYLYRNCGEDGVIRHTTPSHNLIEENTFVGGGVAIWLGSREGNRCYCQDDAGYAFGSSISDMDHARFNTVRGNKLGGGEARQGIYSREGNVFEDNDYGS